MEKKVHMAKSSQRVCEHSCSKSGANSFALQEKHPIRTN